MKLIGIFFFWFFILNCISAKQIKIYIAPDDHTDYMWSAEEGIDHGIFMGVWNMNNSDETDNKIVPAY